MDGTATDEENNGNMGMTQYKSNIFVHLFSIKCHEFELTLINKSLLFPSYIQYKSTNQVVENLNEDKD